MPYPSLVALRSILFDLTPNPLSEGEGAASLLCKIMKLLQCVVFVLSPNPSPKERGSYTQLVGLTIHISYSRTIPFSAPLSFALPVRYARADSAGGEDSFLCEPLCNTLLQPAQITSCFQFLGFGILPEQPCGQVAFQ